MRGRAGANALHRDAAAALRVDLGGHARAADPPAASITPGSSSRIWNSISARPGMMLGAPGSSVMRPVVHTVRGPQTAGKRSSIATQNLASARPASLRIAIRVVPAWFCSPVNVMRYCQIPTMEVTTPILRPPLSSVSPCSICASRYPICRAAFGLRARPAGKARVAQGLAHGPAAVAVARGVDIGLGDAADIGAAAEEAAEMAFLVAPGRDFDGAVDVRIGIDDAGGFERIDDAERPIEPAGVILAFEMRARQQFRSGFRAGAEHVADAVDLGRKAGLGKPLRQPLPASAICGSENVGL